MNEYDYALYPEDMIISNQYTDYDEISQRNIYGPPGPGPGPGPDEYGRRRGECERFYQEGFRQGFRQGYRQGFREGQRSCYPRPYPGPPR